MDPEEQAQSSFFHDRRIRGNGPTDDQANALLSSVTDGPAQGGNEPAPSTAVSAGKGEREAMHERVAGIFDHDFSVSMQDWRQAAVNASLAHSQQIEIEWEVADRAAALSQDSRFKRDTIFEGEAFIVEVPRSEFLTDKQLDASFDREGDEAGSAAQQVEVPRNALEEWQKLELVWQEKKGDVQLVDG